MAIPEITNIPVLGALPNIPKLYASSPNISFIVDMVLLSVVFGSLLAPLGYRIVKEKKLGYRFGAVLGLIFGVASAFALHNAGVTLFTYWLTSAAVAVVISVVIYKIMRALGANKVWAGIVFVAVTYVLLQLWFVESGFGSEKVRVGFGYLTLLMFIILIIIFIGLIPHLAKISGKDFKDFFGKIFRIKPQEPTPGGPAPPGAPPEERKPKGLLDAIFGIRRPTPPGGPTAPEAAAEEATKATKTAKEAGDAAIAGEKETEKVAEEGVDLTDQFRNALMRLLAKIDELLHKTTGEINKYDVLGIKKQVDAIIPMYAALGQLLGRLQANMRALLYYERALTEAMSQHNTLEREMEDWERTKPELVEFKTAINSLRDETAKARLLWALEQIEKKITALKGIIDSLNPLIARINSQHLPALQRMKVDKYYAVLYDVLAAHPERLKKPLEYASSALSNLARTAKAPPDETRALLENIKKLLSPLATVDAPKLRMAWEGISTTHEAALRAIQQDVMAWNKQYQFVPTRFNEIQRLCIKLTKDCKEQQAREEAEEKAEFEVPAPPSDAAAELAGISDELRIQRRVLEPMVESVFVVVEAMNKEIDRSWSEPEDLTDDVFLKKVFGAARTKTGFKEAAESRVRGALGMVSLQHRRAESLIRTLPAGTPELLQLTAIKENLDKFLSVEVSLAELLINTEKELISEGLTSLRSSTTNLQKNLKNHLIAIANTAMDVLGLLAPPSRAPPPRPPLPPESMPVPGG